MKNVAVILPTYNRAETVKQTIKLLDKHIVIDGKLRFYVGCDGDDDTPEVLSDLRQDIFLNPNPSGSFGANINRLISMAVMDGYDLLLQLDDDHHLKEDLDLNEHARFLVDFEQAGWIRLMGVSYHNFDASLKGMYWYIDWASPELYITSMRPHLKHRRFHETYGMYPEDLKLGETEESFCHQCKNVSEGPSVLIPLDVKTESLWDHVGSSWQLAGK
jgi:glycosyltransferase involved in cell wall biosynthesis